MRQAKVNKTDDRAPKSTTMAVAIVVGVIFVISIAATAWVIMIGLENRPGSPSNDDTEQRIIDRRLELVN